MSASGSAPTRAMSAVRIGHQPELCTPSPEADVSRIRRNQTFGVVPPAGIEPTTHGLGNGVAFCAAMEGDRADVLWTDPPYGVDYVGKTAASLRITGDRPEGLGRLLEQAFPAAGPVLAS